MEESYGEFAVNRIQLLPLGEVPGDLLDELGAKLPAEFRAACDVLPADPEPSYAFNSNRRQYCSTEILARLTRRVVPSGSRLLGVTCFDLYIPILTFVFGEAQLTGPCAVVSAHRLRQEFYGLPPDAPLLRERLMKEVVHELGHTFGLTHCGDHECVMASSHSVEWIDIKTSRFCSNCRSVVLLPQSSRTAAESMTR